MKISLVMIVKNEEKVLSRCLNSVHSSVDEIIVVDTGSLDKTKEIAVSFGANVYDYTWNNDFSAARNFGLSKAAGDWIFVLDADEYVSSNQDIRTILTSFTKTENNIGQICIESVFEENGIVQSSTSHVSRFFPQGILFKGKIHEQLDSNFPRIPVGLKVLHDGYLHQKKSGRNIPLLLEELKVNPNDSYYLFQLAKEYRGIEDYSSSLDSFEKSISFLTRKEIFSSFVLIEYFQTIIKAKAYEKGLHFIRKEDSFLSNFSDYHFAKGTFYMNYFSTKPNATLEEIQLIEKAYLTCLQIGEVEKVDHIIGTGSFLASYNLGLLYELFGMKDLAVSYYQSCVEVGFKPAIYRLNGII